MSKIMLCLGGHGLDILQISLENICFTRTCRQPALKKSESVLLRAIYLKSSTSGGRPASPLGRYLDDLDFKLQFCIMRLDA
eukprot:jgi/Botrbrau1/14213/Bobra.0254s0003.1